MKRKTPKKPSGLISTIIKGFAVFFVALLIISLVTKNRIVQDGLFYLVMSIFILGTYKKFLSTNLEDNTLINKIIKSVGIFFIGFMFMSGIRNLITNKILSRILGWVWIIGTVYLIYLVFRGASLGGAKGVKPSSNDGEGIIFGKKGSTVYYMPEEEEGHVIVIGGQGTGKTQSISLPTLFTWKGAAIVIDIKGELHGFTGEYREKVMGSKVYIFDPDSPDCDCYDPLEQIKGIDGATELARNIIPLPNTGDKFWSECAQGVFASAILDGINKNQAFGDICERILVTEPNELIQDLFNSEDNRVKLLCSAANKIAENTLTGVFSTLRTYILTFASDEKIRRATRKTSWTPAVLEEGATIYLRIHESMIGQYKGLIASMISQTFRYLTRRKDQQKPAILILLDELPRLGKVEGLVESMGTLRSRNVHIVPIVQSLSDLDRHYGQEIRKIIIDNTSYKVILGVGDYDTQKYLSDLSGTEKVWQKSYSTNGLLGMKKGHTDSLVEEKIIKPERFGQLKVDKKSIIFGFKEPIEVGKMFAHKTSKYKKLMDTYRA